MMASLLLPINPVSTCSIADDAPFVRNISPGDDSCPSLEDMNLATSFRNSDIPCEFVYAPVPAGPTASFISRARSMTSDGNADDTTGLDMPYSSGKSHNART